MNSLKGIIAVAIATISIYENWIGWLFVFYVITMIIDVITGMICAWKQGQWSSRTAVAGLWRKCGSIFAVFSATLTDILVQTLLQNFPELTQNFPEKIVLFPVVLTWYCVTEIGSIVENAGRLGAPIPKLLKNAIFVLNDALDDEPHK